MKFVVYKKWASKLLPATILVNLNGLFLILLASIAQYKEATTVLICVVVALVGFNGLMFNIYRTVA
mgnify:FL=1